jgi:hypothetical protein
MCRASSTIRFAAIIPIICVLVFSCGKRTKQRELSSSNSIDLDDYRWKNRVLLVFAESDKNPLYRDFMDAWSREKEGFGERDLLVFQILLQGRSEGPRGPLTSQQSNDLRDRFVIAGTSFGIVLIGKDGGVTLRTGDANVAKIFGLIDSMPMRRAEMQQQEANRKK